MSAQGFTEQGSITPDNLFAGEFPCVQRTETITGGMRLPRGAVLGRINDSGLFTLSKLRASDGSQLPVAILAEDCDATTDTQAVVYHAGEFNAKALTYGEGHTAKSVWECRRAAAGNNTLFLRNNQEA